MGDNLTPNDALLVGLDYDPKYIAAAAATTTTTASSSSSSTSAAFRPCLSHLQTSGHGFEPALTAQDFAAATEWQFQQPQPPQQQPQAFAPQHNHHHHHDISLQYAQQQTTADAQPQFTTAYDMAPLQASPEFAAAAASEPQWDPAFVDAPYIPLSAAAAAAAAPSDTLMPFNFQDLHAGLTSIPRVNGLPDLPYTSAGLIDSSSPTDTYLEVRSLTSSSSDNGWSMVDQHHHTHHHHQYHHQHQQPPPHSFGSLSPPFPAQTAVTDSVFINPTQTLHNRSLSESSYSDLDLDLDPNHPRNSIGSFLDLSHPLNSPPSDTNLELDYSHSNPRRVSCDLTSHSSLSPTAVSPVAMVRPMPVNHNRNSSNNGNKAGSSSSPPSRSPKAHSQSSGTSPPTRRPSRKSPIAAKTSETRVRKLPQGGSGNSSSNRSEVSEKRVGKRKGPLNPDQRKQASEIRKLRACLRCKFLKKTCDKGEPCAGCQPSHARLWQVPCTRIDIKDIAYFMKDWRADYERHVSLGFSVSNIKAYSEVERTLFITHGYGQVMPIAAREVFVHDDRCFDLDWVEAMNRNPSHFELKTARLSAGAEGVSTVMLSEYLDRHIDGNGSFEKFVDDYFEGTPFLTQMLKTAFRYYFRTKLPVVRKALKLVLAYNLTLHVTMVEGVGELEEFVGKVEEETSKYNGKTMAPVMINFQIKCAMANMWREMQKDVLEELSGLYSSVYSGDKLKNWPTIFILACILLAVWEEMQFDCHYRVRDAAVVDKFCTDMETTPVGVVVGLFQAISQKLPAFSEWDTQKHHHILNSNPDVCHTMTEVRHHVNEYESYLRDRPKSTFDCNDFDCLSNKFLSRLVIRAN